MRQCCHARLALEALQVQLKATPDTLCKPSKYMFKQRTTAPEALQIKPKRTPEYTQKHVSGPSQAQLAREVDVEGEVMKPVPPCDTPKGPLKWTQIHKNKVQIGSWLVLAHEIEWR